MYKHLPNVTKYFLQLSLKKLKSILLNGSKVKRSASFIFLVAEGDEYFTLDLGEAQQFRVGLMVDLKLAHRV